MVSALRSLAFPQPWLARSVPILVFFGLRALVNSIGLKLSYRVGDVALAHKSITLEHTAGTPPTDSHNNTFCDAGTSKISRGGPAQVVKEQTRLSRIRAASCPHDTEIADGLFVGSREHEVVCALMNDASF